MKLIIAGGRNFKNYSYLKVSLKESLNFWNKKPSVVISGGAIGADTLAIDWALEAKLDFIIMKPEYDKFDPKIAPILRNKAMAKEGTHLVAFWDGESKGTLNMIEEMRALGKPLIMFGYVNEA